MTIKYIMHPDFLESNVTGHLHYVTTVELIKLYGLDPNDCEEFDRDTQYSNATVHLWPRFSGDYSI